MSKMSLEIASDKLIKISYSAIIGILFTVAAFATWMTSMESKAQAHSEAIENIETKNEETSRILISIDKRLSRIETLLEQQFNK